ncbi:protein-tyrosine phosphatase [Dysgonomonas sp. PH5-45]|uniref:low molecular weight protein-tyrosine-phosphatase n=1 Tax=unclassified Dysgonomonas TaxID=2630389 RepID=UPI002474ADA5|nr:MULTISPECIES: low molecular weight protein-tyrosine-phosphatase [unclassified Dysgonomonas]MDH6353727.1 protein-tyrosine phosphatase [Dysgonomonas sp. PH5-45]MDH6386630.1 protein-tyrosine phosphatase [Dysgonomonas sp. PH5-37]
MDNNQKEYKVLFVCLGNICRSPAGEGIFKKLVEDKGLAHRFFIDSAGTGGWHIGELPDARMRQHGARRGYDFNSRARKFDVQDFDDFDIILAMDDSNYNNIMRLSPDLESGQKVYRMTDFSRKYSYDHVPDPYYSGADGFELVLDLLEDACGGLLENILEQGNDLRK